MKSFRVHPGLIALVFVAACTAPSGNDPDGGAPTEAGLDASDANRPDLDAAPAPSDAGSPVTSLSLVLDEAHRVTARIGPAGGELQLGDGAVALSIPAGALRDETEISMTPVVGAEPVAVGAAVALEPEGLSFLVPATLRFSGRAGDAFVFGWAGSGAEPHSIPEALVDRRDGDVVFSIHHFSGAGTGSGSPPRFEPTEAEARAHEAIAALERAELATGAPTDHHARAAILRELLADVRRQIDEASIATDPAEFDRAIARAIHAVHGLIGTAHMVGLLDVPELAREVGMWEADLVGHLRDALVGELMRIRARAVLARDWRIERSIAERLDAFVSAVVPDVSGDPVFSSEALARDSNVDVVLDEVRLEPGPNPLLTLSARAQAIFLGEPLPDELVEIDVSIDGAVVSGSGAFSTTLLPVMARASVDVEPRRALVGASVTASFTGLEPTRITPSASADVLHQSAPGHLVLTGGGLRGHAAARPGSVVPLEATVTLPSGEPGTGALVTFFLAGPGSLSATTAIADGDGVARVDYVPGTTAGSAQVTALAVFSGHRVSSTLEIHVGVADLALDPTLAIVTPGGTADFTVTLRGTPDLVDAGVVVGATGGSFVLAGPNVTYTAPTTPGRYQLRATALADPTSVALADVAVLDPARRVQAEIISDPGDACTGGARVTNVRFTALEGTTRVPGALLRITLDGSTLERTTNASGVALLGRRPIPGVEARVEWIEGGVSIASTPFLAEMQSQPGDPCSAPCGATCSTFDGPHPGELTPEFACECQAGGCCASGGTSEGMPTYGCFSPASC